MPAQSWNQSAGGFPVSAPLELTSVWVFLPRFLVGSGRLVVLPLTPFLPGVYAGLLGLHEFMRDFPLHGGHGSGVPTAHHRV